MGTNKSPGAAATAPGADFTQQHDQVSPSIRQAQGGNSPSCDGTVYAVSLEDFLHFDFPPREHIIHPFLQTQGCGLVYAYRGVGKTHFSIGCAVCVATGTAFLKFHAPKPRRTLFIDGEMPGAALQERFAKSLARLPSNASMPSTDFLRIITPDMIEGPMPDLSTTEGQAIIEECLPDVEFLVLDNISTLFRSGASENDEESWRGAQQWILWLRRQSVSTLLVHHASKTGLQRGTSKREDILDSSILLKRPRDYRAQEGARFEVHFEKTRGIVGNDAAPFEAWLQGDTWTITSLEDADLHRATELSSTGLSLRDIGKELGISYSTVRRLLKKHESGQ